MTTVTGTLLEPDGSLANGIVTFYLIGTSGARLQNALLTNGTLVGSTTVDVQDGVYSIQVSGNDDILPAGSRWVRVYGRSVAVLEVPTSGTVAEHTIPAEPPGELPSAALSLHAADEELHGGGVQLAHTQITTDFSTTLDAATDIATLAFVVPDRPYEVRAHLPVQASVSGVIVYLEIIETAGSNIIVDEWFRGAATDDKKTMKLEFQVPTARVNHAPAAGSTVTYKLRMWRTGSAGTASTRITGFGVPVRDAYLSAKTC